LFLFNQIISNKSFLRTTHYLFLKKYVKVKNFVADLGSGKKSDYHKLISDKKTLIDRYDFHKGFKDVYKIDLEKKFKLKKKYDHIILFNVLEHIYNNESLILSINKNLKKNGKLELFVPFMYKFHSDPKDFIRPTHSYLEKILMKNGFKVKITLICTGQMAVIFEILLKYIKFNPLKFIFSIIFIFLNNMFRLFSKDFDNYYSGIHCSCIKLK
jgi:SAM-dependent methyltransferase